MERKRECSGFARCVDFSWYLKRAYAIVRANIADTSAAGAKKKRKKINRRVRRPAKWNIGMRARILRFRCSPTGCAETDWNDGV